MSGDWTRFCSLFNSSSSFVLRTSSYAAAIDVRQPVRLVHREHTLIFSHSARSKRGWTKPCHSNNICILLLGIPPALSYTVFKQLVVQRMNRLSFQSNASVYNSNSHHVSTESTVLSSPLPSTNVDAHLRIRLIYIKWACFGGQISVEHNQFESSGISCLRPASSYRFGWWEIDSKVSCRLCSWEIDLKVHWFPCQKGKGCMDIGR